MQAITISTLELTVSQDSKMKKIKDTKFERKETKPLFADMIIFGLPWWLSW